MVPGATCRRQQRRCVHQDDRATLPGGDGGTAPAGPGGDRSASCRSCPNAASARRSDVGRRSGQPDRRLHHAVQRRPLSESPLVRRDRKSVVEGKSVSGRVVLVGRRIIKQKKNNNNNN